MSARSCSRRSVPLVKDAAPLKVTVSLQTRGALIVVAPLQVRVPAKVLSPVIVRTLEERLSIKSEAWMPWVTTF